MVGINPKDGKKLWGYPWKTKYGVNSADPILLGDKVFISSGYDRGCALLKVDGTKVTKIWENKNMCNHFNACVLIDGYLYGFSGNTGRGTLRCLEMATGEMKWEEKRRNGDAKKAKNSQSSKFNKMRPNNRNRGKISKRK